MSRLPQIAKDLLADPELARIAVRAYIQLCFTEEVSVLEVAEEDQEGEVVEDTFEGGIFDPKDLDKYECLSKFKLDRSFHFDTLVKGYSDFTWGDYITGAVMTKWVDPFKDLSASYTCTHRTQNSAVYTQLGMIAISRRDDDDIERYAQDAQYHSVRNSSTWWLYSSRCVVYRLLTSNTRAAREFRRMIGLTNFKVSLSNRVIKSWVLENLVSAEPAEEHSKQ